MNEDVEIIGVYNEKEIENKNKLVKKKKFKKKLFFQTLFCTFSILFIIGCFIFYGTRLVKYYKIYNPSVKNGEKTDLLSSYIQGKSNIVYEKDGLYKTSNGHVYKGINVENYINFSNLTWRIIQINSDGTMNLVLDNYINILKWNNKITNYQESDINKYLNEEFIKILNKEFLSKTIVCDDVINNINEFSCKNTNTDNYIRLLNINEFLNSKSEKTYIANEKNIWLSNHGKDGIWNINGENISYSEPTETYLIKPVITLKNSASFLSGKGTKEEPYIFEDSKTSLDVGKYVKLGEDTWTIYESSDDTIKLSLSNLYLNGSEIRSFDFSSNKYKYESKDSLAEYLNTTYLDSLSYKDLLLDTTWYIGKYENSYKDIYNEKINCKVGLSSVVDLKIDNDISGYYLLNGLNNGKIYLYTDFLVDSKPVLSRPIKPSIGIKKSLIKSGNGTKTNPYVLEM